MNLDKVIECLNEIRDEHGGDIPVFVNGEHGEGEPEMADPWHFSVGEAKLTLGGDCGEKAPFGLREKQTMMQIGGY